MASIFSITTATNSIPIGKQRNATVLITVTNISGQALTGRAVLVMDPPNEAQVAWLQLSPPQKSERHFDVNGVQDYSIEVNVPVEIAARDSIFHLDMVDIDNPDETYTVGPGVKLLVGEPEKKEKKPFPWWIIGVAVGVLAVIIGLVIFWPSRITPLSGKIAFISLRDGALEVYVMNADGNNQIRLTNRFTNNHAGGNGPAWSPDGGQIAFSSYRDIRWEIYVMNAFGNNPIRLTNNDADDFYPTWSPDGRKIAFASNRDGNFEIYMMNANGSGQIRLTDSNAFDREPAWSPDGNKIAFSSNRTGNFEIYMLDLDSNSLSQLTTINAEDRVPAWSPNGSKIVFVSERDGNQEIYVMNADGSNPIRLTNNNTTDSAPSWSPDGSKIAFHTDRDGIDFEDDPDSNYEIYAMNADGSNPIRLTNNNEADWDPSWAR
jgi:Tol biopolymer transport system component